MSLRVILFNFFFFWLYFFFLVGLGSELRASALAKQTLYCLSRTSSPFYSGLMILNFSLQQ
jgi:hypothetical protein